MLASSSSHRPPVLQVDYFSCHSVHAAQKRQREERQLEQQQQASTSTSGKMEAHHRSSSERELLNLHHTFSKKLHMREMSLSAFARRTEDELELEGLCPRLERSEFEEQETEFARRATEALGKLAVEQEKQPSELYASSSEESYFRRAGSSSSSSSASSDCSATPSFGSPNSSSSLDSSSQHHEVYTPPSSHQPPQMAMEDYFTLQSKAPYYAHSTSSSSSSHSSGTIAARRGRAQQLGKLRMPRPFRVAGSSSSEGSSGEEEDGDGDVENLTRLPRKKKSNAGLVLKPQAGSALSQALEVEKAKRPGMGSRGSSAEKEEVVRLPEREDEEVEGVRLRPKAMRKTSYVF